MARLKPSIVLLTLVDSNAAVCAYATYGGVYIVASILWLWVVEGRQPDRWDLAGGQSASWEPPSS